MRRSQEITDPNERLYWLCSPVCLEWQEGPEKTSRGGAAIVRRVRRMVHSLVQISTKSLVRVLGRR